MVDWEEVLLPSLSFQPQNLINPYPMLHHNKTTVWTLGWQKCVSKHSPYPQPLEAITPTGCAWGQYYYKLAFIYLN